MVMTKKHKTGERFFLTTTDGIGRYLNTVITYSGFWLVYDVSDSSDSCYLRCNTGTRENPQSILIRISNHPMRKVNVSIDYDLYAGFCREGAINYIQLIFRLNETIGLSIPERAHYLRPGTSLYRDYKIEMQKYAAMERKYGHWPRRARLYV